MGLILQSELGAENCRLPSHACDSDSQSQSMFSKGPRVYYDHLTNSLVRRRHRNRQIHVSGYLLWPTRQESGSINLLLLLLCLNVLGTNRGPTDRIQHIKKALNDMSGGYKRFSKSKHSLRRPPHAFGSDWHSFI